MLVDAKVVISVSVADVLLEESMGVVVSKVVVSSETVFILVVVIRTLVVGTVIVVDGVVVSISVVVLGFEFSVGQGFVVSSDSESYSSESYCDSSESHNIPQSPDRALGHKMSHKP